VKKRRPAKKRNPGGRPRKFAEASRAVTVTLPESTLSDLAQISSDRSRAIAELARGLARGDGNSRPLVEIVEMAKNTGLVIVNRSEALRKIPFLRQVKVAPGRYLIALDNGNNFHSLEIALIDALEEKDLEKRERKLMSELLKRIKGLRKADRVSMAEILFVRLR
jgi:hypothetical protein